MAAEEGTLFEASAITFGRRFKQQRDLQKLSRDQLAEVTGLSTDYISSIEAGTANPTLEAMVMLADAVGAEVWDLLAPR